MRKDSQTARWIVQIGDLPKVIEFIGRTRRKAFYKLTPSKNGLGISLNVIEEKCIGELDLNRQPK
ncbi:hypothetical protein Pr1d_34960 [Bythopirellula goksoeyrii]|uniref:Uncharacterized protein n=1 Tax=Bythopirellula goksoeyrii TaxID=1400387 RepID=A0A5B9QAY4_9BACT|nr:hypothetical protein Pr1d_34960 [Bythopirellula goksoeyrii]